MIFVEPDARRPNRSKNRSGCLALVLASLAAACGGKSAAVGSAQVSGTGGAGGSGTSGASGAAASGGSGGMAMGKGGSSGGSADAGRGAGTGGSGTQESGGAAGSVAQGGVGGRPPPLGGFSGAAGDAGATCSADAIWAAVRMQVIGECHEASAMLAPGEQPSRRRGAVVIDDEGRVVDNTGLSGDAKQQWLDRFAEQRFPCLAGQSIGYECTAAG